MTASLDELLDALAGPPPEPVGLATLHHRHRQRQRRRRATRGLVAGTAVLALLGLTALVRSDGYQVDTVDQPTAADATATTAPDQTRVLVNPVLDATTHLAQPSPRVRFRVAASQPSYWRTAGMADYDGSFWSGRYEDGEAPRAAGKSPLGGTSLVQTITFDSPDVVWLPAAPELVEATSDDVALQWDAASGTLMAGPILGDGPSWSYRVTSTVAGLTPDELRSAPADTPGERYTALPPGGATAAVAAEAERITAGAATRYDQALALQGRLRTLPYQVGDVPLDAATIEAVVVGGEGGASPQLATAFVVMARHVGIPSRIAVGYTWGQPVGIDGDRTIYEVTDRHTHVWPEVWFAGIGWVAFEPTPGRGMPGAEAYTAVAAQQDDNNQPGLGS